MCPFKSPFGGSISLAVSSLSLSLVGKNVSNMTARLLNSTYQFVLKMNKSTVVKNSAAKRNKIDKLVLSSILSIM